MSTDIRPEISEKNRYWISKHRYYELKHFCLQYREWKQAYLFLNDFTGDSTGIIKMTLNTIKGDPTQDLAVKKAYFDERMTLVESLAREADKELADYIFKAVTEGYSYNYLKTVMDIPCERDMYYDRYRKFFWLLSKER